MSRREGRRRRADAERNVAAILDAALEVLSRRPRATMDEVARAAGVTRQTVYAHYTSREALLDAIQASALAEAVAAIDAVNPDHGPAPEALDRMIGASWEVLGRHALIIDALMERLDPERLRELHQPILDRLERLIKRGRRSKAFDRELPLEWALAAVLALLHETAQEVRTGRVGADEGAAALRRAVPRLLGAEPT